MKRHIKSPNKSIYMAKDSKPKIDRPRGYLHGSKTSRTLDFLVAMGIDTLKIKAPHI